MRPCDRKRRDEISAFRSQIESMSEPEILALPPMKYRVQNSSPKNIILLGSSLDAKTGCWEWMKSRSTARGCGTGYGSVYANGRAKRAHRVSYEAFVGKIPVGLVIDHRCGNQGCVNPGHLRAVTQQVNVLASSGLGAKYAVATHCRRGHPFAGENLVNLPNGYRRCKRCQTMSVEERLANPVCEEI